MEKNSAALFAIIPPKPSISAISSSDAAIIELISPKCSERSFAAFCPIWRMPRANSRRERSFCFERSIASTRFLPTFPDALQASLSRLRLCHIYRRHLISDFGDKLFDEGVAESLDIHGITRTEMDNIAQQLSRALGIDTADSRLALFADNGSGAGRAD